MSMSDFELLTLAAKACGVDKITPAGNAAHNPFPETGHLYWNPLAEDGDALRLAVMLRLKVYHAGLAVIVEPVRFSHEWMGEMVNADSGDRFAATRRVIVRAAAEIAKQASA